MSTDDGISRLEQVDSDTVWGPCGHPDAAKLLLATGETRPETTKQVEVEPGVYVPVTYVAPDAPVTHVVTTVCAECGGHEVWESTTAVVIPAEPALPPPPPPTIDVTGLTVQPAPDAT
ncbi:MAG: hypothetical protein JWP11_1286 [Frankiales bacterium]|nr:hypothetical protein [Frankiales bacterium]